MGRTLKEFLLAAAIALALARRSGTLILDDALFWCTGLESTPDEFLEAVRLRPPAESLDEASVRFYDALPNAKRG